MQTQRIAISELNLDPANVRRHPARNLDAIKASLNRFGQQRPVLVNAKGIIIAGNGTVMAAKALGWEHINIVRTDLEGSEATAYAIADNRTAELAEWDDEALAQQLAALQIDDEELAKAAGFSEAEIAELAGATVEVQEDEVPEPPADPITKAGDLWLLGEHRLLCGDSTKAEDVERLMAGAKAGMVFTDPPYGIKFQSNFREKTPQFEKIANDDTILNISPILSSAMKDNTAAYVCTRWDVYPKWCGQLSDFDIKNCVVWYKRGGGLGDLSNCFSPNHEFLIVAHNGTAPLRGKRLPDVWEVARDGVTAYNHPTQKPVGLPAIAIKAHSDSHDIVMDLFLGSGTTLIAAEQLGRKCYGMEISPAYCDVIVKRWENLTGKKATRHAAQASKA